MLVKSRACDPINPFPRGWRIPPCKCGVDAIRPLVDDAIAMQIDGFAVCPRVAYRLRFSRVERGPDLFRYCSHDFGCRFLARQRPARGWPMG